MNGAGAAVTVLSRDARDDHPNGTDLGAAPDDRLPTHAAASDGIPQLLPFQARVRRAYLWHPVQFGIAAVIFANFVTTAIDKQMRPADGSPTALAIANAEIFFAAVFGLELIANLYAHWLRPFFSSAWNWFDLFIVVVGWVSLANAQMPGISVLRLFRALKVLRLFRRIESIKVIVEGVAAAMPGMANAFIILGILMGIWAIIGVQFFAEFAPQEFGTFLRAMFTMWQVMTMDGWASGIARPLIFDVDQSGALAVIFFVSFTFVAGIVMANVVVAILLEKYLGATADNEVRKAKAASTERAHAAEKRSTESAKALDKTRAKDRLLDNDDIIDLITETVKRKNLQGLSKDDLISLALAVWHQPSMADNVPAVLRSNMRVAPQHQSRSILLNVMQRGIASTGAPGGGRIRRESTADFAFASSRAQ